MWSPGKQGSEGFDLFIWIKNRKINQQAAKSSTWKKIQPPSSKNTTSLPPPKIQPPSPQKMKSAWYLVSISLYCSVVHMGQKFTSCHMIRLTFCHMTYCWLALWCIVLGKVGRSSNLSYSRWNSFGTLLQFCTSKK